MEKEIRVLTFDIEEWFHLLDLDVSRSIEKWDNFQKRIHTNTHKILELLAEKKQKATFFCLGWVAEKYPEIVKMIDEAGYELGSHSMYHQLAYELSPDQFKEDLKKSIDLIQSIISKKVRYYRVPGFSITRENAWALETLIECGIEVDSSIFPAARGHGGYESFGTDKPALIKTPSGQLKEFPINTVSFMGKELVFSGGGYFRLLPYAMIDSFMKRSSYVMTYFHPRDFDAGQPVLDGLSFQRRFKSYYGLGGAFKKLSRLLDAYNFSDIGSIEQKIRWENNKVVIQP